MRTVPSVAVAVVIAAGACQRPVPIGTASWQPRFGPVIGDELVVGRARTRQRVWLMTSTDALVAIDVVHGRHERFPLHPLPAGEHVWGLASTGHGDGLWTLSGRRELARVTEEGLIDRRFALEDPHVAVYSGAGELVYQVVNMPAPADALVAGPPGASPRRSWSSMRTRAMPLQRGQAAALNLVSCGASERERIPCWFSDQASVTLTDARGRSEEVHLEGLAGVEPQALLDAQVPRRPIADTWLSSGGELWVLTAGTPKRADLSDRRGAWMLGRYRTDGTVLRRAPLEQPARLILQVNDAAATLLAWDGTVVEVRP